MKQRWKTRKKNDTKISDLEGKVSERERMINLLKTQNITYQLVLDDADVNSAPPLPGSLQCVYYRNWTKSDSAILRVSPGAGPGACTVTFENLTLDQLSNQSPFVCLFDSKTRKKWICRSFNPLTPTLFLQPNNQEDD